MCCISDLLISGLLNLQQTHPTQDDRTHQPPPPKRPEILTCCLRTSCTWHTPLKRHSIYTTGHHPTRAIVLLHHLLGWSFPNLRLLADRYAHSAPATVFLPDFFGGESLPAGPILAGRWAELDLPGFLGRNARSVSRRSWLS
ncbi:hypothetical protein BO99DRAFT_433755 [Aspergillus violaceofuscus CBS 115571]|uniref:Uncharacterized protein n=1 Tax=Aspergillus violaceofuscus (strain CBS 115571) TaxID=1450538 RepID=A0A2V5H422_ASPV1|nr:hypothetical protein BO99DRAFT_433755 [Aspergillus violaceofuscus CBS 115571]